MNNKYKEINIQTIANKMAHTTTNNKSLNVYPEFKM